MLTSNASPLVADDARLPKDASTLEGAAQYFATRARQLWHEGYRWDGVVQRVEGAARTVFTRGEEEFVSLYVLAEHRGRGTYRRLAAQEDLQVVTVADCGIEEVLKHLGKAYTLAGALLETPEYALVSAYYGDRRAKRSGAFLMNHIDEGLAVLSAIGANTQSKRAFCLHPLLRDDSALAENFDRVYQVLVNQPGGAHSLALALEYRNIANAYLSQAPMPSDGIRLSPLPAVNDMLVADKVQNRKDFERFHARSHPNRERLSQYFEQWCDALGVGMRYPGLKAGLPPF
jgi:hypothetical protein